MDEVADSAGGPLLFGRYRIVEQLGMSRLALVYQAIDERLQRTVMMHILRKELVDNAQLRQCFVDEISASAQVTHPALLQVFDSGEANERPYMVTEYVGGRALSHLGAQRLEHALLYARQVAGAVAACLAHNVPHPPISSSNVLLAGEGQVKLVENWHMPASEVLLDLAHYRAPEVTVGDPPTPASVVYSIGLLLYELVSGARPLQGSNAQEVAQAHLSLHLPPLLHARPLIYLPTLEQLITRATSRVPEQRISDAILLSEEIDRLWRSLSSETRRFTVASVPPRQRRTAPPTPTAAPAPVPGESAVRAGPASSSPLHRSLQTLTRWAITLLFVLLAITGSYLLAGVLVDQLFAVKLPLPSMPSMPDVGGLFGGDSEPQPDHVLIVNINEGLNLRDAPGLSSNVVAIVRNGARVTRLEGPQVVDNVEWVRVRVRREDTEPSAAATGNQRMIEGWMSQLYLEAEQ